MLKKADIKNIAKGRYEDAEVLFNNKRYDGSFYLCGYVIEFGLKHRICETLNWDGYPSANEFKEGLLSFKTHDLGILLKLSGKEKFIKSKFLAQWSIVENWDPEKRYEPIGNINPKTAKMMLNSSKIILDKLL